MEPYKKGNKYSPRELMERGYELSLEGLRLKSQRDKTFVIEDINKNPSSVGATQKQQNG